MYKRQVTGGLPATINNCVNEAEILTDAPSSYGMGGIVGGVKNGGNATITKCGNFGSLTCVGSAGGIFGYNIDGTCVIENCYNRGRIWQRERSPIEGYGGIAGMNMNSDNGSLTITSCYNAGTVEAETAYGAIRCV